MTRFDADAYVESGLDFMVVSIDGATQKIYERFRRNGNLELVLENLRALVEAKRRVGSRTPVLSWNYLAFEHNAHEIPQAERMAGEMGVNFFRVVNPFDVAWDDPEIRPAAVKARMQALDWRSRVEAPPLLAGELDADAIGSAFDRGWSDAAPEAEPAPGSGPGQTGRTVRLVSGIAARRRSAAQRSPNISERRTRRSSIAGREGRWRSRRWPGTRCPRYTAFR